MPRIKKAEKSLLALPPQAQEDIKTVGGILEKWAKGSEDIIKDAFKWVIKHKMLALVTIGLVAFYRYWLMEPEEKATEYEEGEDF